ncbi:MAG: phosphoglycerate kinase [Chloroflexi bacterium]|nr:phosphoglycerate kinase [Chloroflexota bacterium]
MFRKKTVRDVDVTQRRVLVRVDFNVPIRDGRVEDDTRIRATLPTLTYLLARDAALVLASHLGRPKGKPDPAFSLRPVVEPLAALLGRDVLFAHDPAGPDAQAKAARLQPGQVLLLENTRFDPGETRNDPEFARRLASLGELFVNDAFGTAHRIHASTVGVARYLPAVAGFLLEREVTIITQALERPTRPLMAILGGAKISDKIKVLHNLLGRADRLLIGGGMANTFLAAQGFALGSSLVEREAFETALSLLDTFGEKIVLPTDLVIADRAAPDANVRVVAVTEGVPEGWMALDIGPSTVETFARHLREAGTIIWNGPLGMFEVEPFAAGTMAIARVLAESPAFTLVGGGDSVAAVKKAGVADRMGHISTGGGATLKLLAGEPLPAVEVLEDRT